MVAKGVDCYSYITDPLNSVLFTVPSTTAGGGQSLQTATNSFENTNLQVQSSQIPLTSFIGTFTWTAQINSKEVQTGHNNINTFNGNLSDGTMMDMMSMPTIFGPVTVPNTSSPYTICYGFYDAGTGGVSGLTNQDQCWIYFTDNYANWMGNLIKDNPGAAELDFCTFVLPGAHDAGMNTMDNITGLLGSNWGSQFTSAITKGFAIPATITSLVVQNMAITQKDTITDMLDIGIRYFDFRPGYMLPPMSLVVKYLYHQHNMIPGMAYMDFLHEILSWLDANPSELVVVNCNTQNFAADSMKPSASDLTNCLNDARNLTGVTSAMVAAGDASALNQPIKTLLASNTRLIFLNQIENETTKYDSYSSGYATLDPSTIVQALSAMNSTDQAKYTYTVLQLQGTATSIPSVLAGGIVTLSSTASPLMATKAQFDQTTLPWVAGNVPNNLSREYLTVLLNDFADNATVATAIELTRNRMGLF